MKTPHFPLSSINLLAIRWQNLHRYCPRFFFLPPRKLSARIGLYGRLIYLVFRQLGPCCRCLSESTCISNERRGRNVANWRRVVECVNQGQCCYRISPTLRPSFVSFTRSFVDLDFDVVVVDVDRQLRLGGATHTRTSVGVIVSAGVKLGATTTTRKKEKERWEEGKNPPLLATQGNSTSRGGLHDRSGLPAGSPGPCNPILPPLNHFTKMLFKSLCWRGRSPLVGKGGANNPQDNN